ncbi:hypothetical protein, partial [Achromobacter xylosoxidans]|uniref:hypothetical protein n=1 Tax=Alcaligenes xylosoxydans xylosoxydans TaxID=85698 RepID=UPI001A7F09B4
GRLAAAALYNRRAPGAESNKNVRNGGMGPAMQHGSGSVPSLPGGAPSGAGGSRPPESTEIIHA